MTTNLPSLVKDEIARRIAAGEEIDVVLESLNTQLDDPGFVSRMVEHEDAMNFLEDEARRAVEAHAAESGK